MNDEPRTLSITEVANALGVSRTTVYEAIRTNQFPLPVIRVGQRMVVSRAALEALLAA